VAVFANPVDEDYINTMGMQIVAGSNLTEQDSKDILYDDRSKRTYHFIINESAAKQLGWTSQDAVGKRLYLDASRPGFVRGVVKDFHFESLHNPIKPMVLFTEKRGWELLLKLKADNLPQTIAGIETKWKTLVPYMPFDYHFVDDDYNKLYNSEMRLGTVMNVFASVAILMACLGLFGLSAYSAQQRVKEIGIRKILGAKLFGIAVLLSKDFLALVAVAFAIAVPVSWWAMAQWLQGYEYRITVNVWVFVAAGAATVFITLATVSYQALKAAFANPVKSLRSE
jgi:putative ABC transport system permease protein